MKERFLALVEEVKLTGIVEVLQKAPTKEEMSEMWRGFLNKSDELCDKIEEWANEFKASNSGPIFKEGEELENPLEIVAVIHIISDERVSEEKIFEEWDDLVKAIRNINNDFAIAVADCIDADYILLITAEQIFIRYEDNK